MKTILDFFKNLFGGSTRTTFDVDDTTIIKEGDRLTIKQNGITVTLVIGYNDVKIQSNAILNPLEPI